MSRKSLLRITSLLLLASALSACVGFEDRCRAYGFAGNSSNFARCVHDHQQALETTLVSIANGFSVR